MESTMRQVMEAAGAINAKLAILSEKAGNINQVVTTITLSLIHIYACGSRA